MRLVDADYLKEKGHYDDHDVFVVDYDDIKNAPTMDTSKKLIYSVNVDTDEIIERIKELGWESVKHGQWIYYEDETIEDGGRCSVCQCDQPVFWEDWTWKYVETDYCPNCGARMDGENDEIG